MRMVVKICLALQLLWYISFVTGVLGKIEAQSEVIHDFISISIPFLGIIIANGYIVTKRKLDILAVTVILLAFSISFKTSI